jgi:hypothetical protein
MNLGRAVLAYVAVAGHEFDAAVRHQRTLGRMNASPEQVPCAAAGRTALPAQPTGNSFGF